MKQNRYWEATEKDRIETHPICGRYECCQFSDDFNGKAAKSSVGPVFRLTR